jgi:hypothetical protein
MAMRVAQTRRTTTAGAGKPARAGVRGGEFQIPSASSAQPRAEVAAPAMVTGVDVIVALQAIEQPDDRRRRAVATGDRILDLLDQLKLGMLSGRVSISDLEKLKRTIERQQLQDNDPELNDILKQINLRAHVELAKLKGSAG